MVATPRWTTVVRGIYRSTRFVRFRPEADIAEGPREREPSVGRFKTYRVTNSKAPQMVGIRLCQGR